MLVKWTKELGNEDYSQGSRPGSIASPKHSLVQVNTHFPANLIPIHTERRLHLMSAMITQIMWVLRLGEAYPDWEQPWLLMMPRTPTSDRELYDFLKNVVHECRCWINWQVFYHLHQSVSDGWGGAMVKPAPIYNQWGRAATHLHRPRF